MLILHYLILIVGCKSTKSNIVSTSNSIIEILDSESFYLKELKRRISNSVVNKDDKETPYRILVDENYAIDFKIRIRKIYNDNKVIRSNLKPLTSIIESCENQDVNWAEYCFKEMPWFGVEPIMNVWIKAIEETIKNIE